MGAYISKGHQCPLHSKFDNCTFFHIFSVKIDIFENHAKILNNIISLVFPRLSLSSALRVSELYSLTLRERESGENETTFFLKQAWRFFIVIELEDWVLHYYIVLVAQ